MVNPAEDPVFRLARRLRALRAESFAGRRLTQGELAEALGASVPSISSWESKTKPKPPPRERLTAYATFFATERSMVRTPFRVLAPQELTNEEQTRRDELFRELDSLRNAAQGDEPSPPVADPFAGSHWRFPPGEDITIVCSALPEDRLKDMPYSNPDAPDYVGLTKYADGDALLELHGHLRAANPLSNVNIRVPVKETDDRVPPDFVDNDYDTSHLVLLGGVDWNEITKEVLELLDVPVRQLERESDEESGGFQVLEGGSERLIRPTLRRKGRKEVLIEDIAHFVRAPSPFNSKLTITICNGNYARGTYGIVRALTDTVCRDSNDDYLRTRFAGEDTFSILSRVKVVAKRVVTPVWSSPEVLLHEWPVRQRE